MARYIVSTTSDLPPGTRRIVDVAGRSIGVFNIAGEYFALRNRCPHQGGPLCEGRLAGLVESSGPGNYAYSRRGEILRCPWHAWEYDIRTGQSYFNPAVVRVHQFEISVADGGAVAAEGAAPGASVTRIEGEGLRTAGVSGIQLGPYVAETYPVSVHEQYVVVEVDE
jgi:3-phenylpropionate/trans-cinnamate dioxygenase ferredoxin subunit